MSALRLLVVVALALLAGCGDAKGALFLTIEGVRADGQALVIPDDVDRAVLAVQTPSGEALLEKTYALSELGQTFPLTLGVEPGETTPNELNVAVTLTRGEQGVGTAKAAVTLEPGKVTLATVRVVQE